MDGAGGLAPAGGRGRCPLPSAPASEGSVAPFFVVPFFLLIPSVSVLSVPSVVPVPALIPGAR